MKAEQLKDAHLRIRKDALVEQLQTMLANRERLLLAVTAQVIQTYTGKHTPTRL